jgi:hypothetical protein
VSLIKRLSGDALCVGLGVDHFYVALRRGKQFKAEHAHQQAVDNPELHWQPVLSEVQSWLRHAHLDCQGLPLRISLAGWWCPLQSVPWSDALLKPKSAQAFLHNQFVATYGEAARNWVLTSDAAPYGQPRVACAIEAELLTGLQALAPGRVQSVESVVSLGARALLAKTGPRAACAIIEPGRFSLLHMDGLRIVAAQAQAWSGSWERELASSWMRWCLRQPELAEIKQVALLNLSGRGAGAGAGTAGSAATGLAAPFQAILMPDYGLPSGFAFLTCDNGS